MARITGEVSISRNWDARFGFQDRNCSGIGAAAELSSFQNRGAVPVQRSTLTVTP
jgi:hypothetical protein